MKIEKSLCMQAVCYLRRQDLAAAATPGAKSAADGNGSAVATTPGWPDWHALQVLGRLQPPLEALAVSFQGRTRDAMSASLRQNRTEQPHRRNERTLELLSQSHIRSLANSRAKFSCPLLFTSLRITQPK